MIWRVLCGKQARFVGSVKRYKRKNADSNKQKQIVICKLTLFALKLRIVLTMFYYRAYHKIMASGTGEGKKIQFIPLPEDEGSEYLAALIHNCIAAYAQVLSDKVALDYNKVPDSLRAIILEDKYYRQETRSIKAKKMMDEIREIEYLADAAMKTDGDDEDGDDEEFYDPRHPQQQQKKKRFAGADKDSINMRFKAAQLRRDLLNLSAGAEGSEEAAALNVFFVPLTREEFAKLAVTDVHEGEESGKGAFKAETDPTLPVASAPASGPPADEPLYTVHENGDVEEL
jgi:hypothetical protein